MHALLRTSQPLLGALALMLLAAAPVSAQSAGQPLNLKLPPSDLPAASTSTGTPASSAPGVYYGDTSGRTDATDRAAAAVDCDDATFNQPQVHGSVSTGVVSGGRRGSGNWNAGTLNVSKAFGDCDHATGGVSISVGAGSGRFHGRGD